MKVSDIPTLNAVLNGLSTLLLLTGFILIKRGNKDGHRKCMVGAFCTSAVFLVGYVAHKILVHGVHTKFGGSGAIAGVYYAMLATHVLLAMVMVPMIFLTMTRAWRGNFEAHKRIARWTWPVWMYVSLTGVLVYFFLYVWWPAGR